MNIMSSNEIIESFFTTARPDDDRLNALKLFTKLVWEADLPGRLHLAYIYRIATDPRSEMFFDEKTNRLPDFFIERIRNVSHAELEATDTDSFWCGIVGDCLDRESLSEAWTPEQWAAKQIEFEELRNQILTKAGEREC